MAKVDTRALISISEANGLGISRLVRDAEQGKEPVLLRNNKPVAVVVGMQRFEELEQLEEDLLDIALAAARVQTDDGRRVSLDDILGHYGYTREQLRSHEAYSD
jgi:prevent-host-death family protein